ncbi:recombinase RecA [Ureaplasma ceti]|uniref:Protein RecA n=1 Tax=Ureaplasma ceti TaxID=3119530 RepID=A0ABP9U994_9BACT
MKNENIESHKNLLSKEYLNNLITLKTLDIPIEVISTGNLQLDNILGCKGIPKGRITEIYGNESCGKTTLALQIAKEATNNNQKVLFLDLEASLDLNYVKGIGINLDNFYVAQAKNGELAFSLIEDALEKKSFDLIVVDSVAAMISELEYETKMESANLLGSHARLMSRGLRRIQLPLSQSQTAVIFINQVREKIGVLFGNPETTTGGKALKFFSSLRIEVKKADLIKNGTDKIGIKSKITVIKNKLGKPYGTCFINIYFGEGFDEIADLLDYAIQTNIIKKSGSWYSHDEKNIAQGAKQLKQYAIDNPEWYAIIKENVLNLLNQTSETNREEIISSLENFDEEVE